MSKILSKKSGLVSKTKLEAVFMVKEGVEYNKGAGILVPLHIPESHSIHISIPPPRTPGTPETPRPTKNAEFNLFKRNWAKLLSATGIAFVLNAISTIKGDGGNVKKNEFDHGRRCLEVVLIISEFYSEYNNDDKLYWYYRSYCSYNRSKR